MADTPNARTRYAEGLLYQVQAAQVWQNLASDLIGVPFADAVSVVLPDFVSNVGTRDPADADALLSGPTFTAATMNGITIGRKLVQAFGRLPRAIQWEAGGGDSAPTAMEQAIIDAMAARLDNRFASVVAGLTYDTVNGSGNDNKLEIGGNTNYLPAGMLPEAAGTSASQTGLEDAAAKALLDALQLLYLKDVLPGTFNGTDGPDGEVTFVAPIQVARLILNHAIRTGTLQTREDIAGQGAIEGGIAGLRAFQGRWAGMNIVSSQATGVAAGNSGWAGYALPTGGVFKGFSGEAITQTLRAEDRVDAVADDSVLTTRWAAGVPRPAHVIQIAIDHSASEKDEILIAHPPGEDELLAAEDAEDRAKGKGK